MAENQQKETQILRLNTTCEIPIMLEGEGLEEVESFGYLGSMVDTRRGTEADVNTRISKASQGISHFEKRVEVEGNRQNNEILSVQHKCQVCVAIRLQNLGE